ncbi:ATP-binding protein [Pseudomonas sp. RC4D1]|uniref:ATP-binding protein n=1 Tax=Pseudomonas sp. RC4D1 TaxID=2834407 RepID=UPI001BCD5D77|nr:ATP-binding protein [Pseudomonas sp. RC4D1]MBS7561671.1 ATP-binding protein [Pseudomonas sp. RC4D1]
MSLLNEIFSSGALLTWPVCINGVKVTIPPDSAKAFVVPDICFRSCGVFPKCIKSEEVIGVEHICDYGVSYYKTTIGNDQVLIYGVKGTKLQDRECLDLSKGLVAISSGEIATWKNGINRLLASIDKSFIDRQQEMLEPLHDPSRLTKQIKDLSVALAKRMWGSDDPESPSANDNPELKSLVKASEMLMEQFDLLTIYFNPEAAKFGRKYSVSIHGLLFKLTKILKPIATEQGRLPLSIYMEGETFRNVNVYRSFKLIPFALISNAVKYCAQGNVKVIVIDRNPEIEVRVENVGPWIEPNETELIFDKRQRGKWAKEMSISGEGVGLYLAQTIASAHRMKIHVSSVKTGEEVGGIIMARNSFYFIIPRLELEL